MASLSLHGGADWGVEAGGEPSVASQRLGRRGLVLAAMVFALAGVLAAMAPLVALAVALLPVLVLLVLRYPEPLMAMFLTSGLLKNDPVVGALIPFDLTVALAAALLLALIVRSLQRGLFFPRQGWVLVPMLLAVAFGVVAAANAYGAEKALRFTTLTVIAIVAPLTLLDDRQRLTRFLVSLAIIGVWVSVSATRVQEAQSWGRVTTGGNPIPLGRAGALAFVFAWLRLQFARQPFERVAAIGILGVSAYSVMNAGSRGPIVSAVFALVLLSVVTQFMHKRAPISVGMLAFVAGVGALALSFISVPEFILHRFELLFSGEGGSSVLMRGFLYATAWQLMLRNPMGIGIGGFEPHAPLDLRYPHNLFLEVGVELGWIPLVSMLLMVFLSARAMLRLLRREYSWEGLFLCLILITTLLNSMVSGDLNDNRPFFAALLLPFALLRIQEREARDRRGVEQSDAARMPASQHSGTR